MSMIVSHLAVVVIGHVISLTLLLLLPPSFSLPTRIRAFNSLYLGSQSLLKGPMKPIHLHPP